MATISNSMVLEFEKTSKRLGERVDGKNIGIYKYETTFEGDTNPTIYKIERKSTKVADKKRVHYWELSIFRKEEEDDGIHCYKDKNILKEYYIMKYFI